ncbi:unnamed protein product [Trypanosoma congolense IL3000]|uniref:WGS project CAEQ00000000 data, annotated contig 1727 n=1 Tax=Trypanosoma congolense (strain IL3000) TaxID=1068625 RepID=F9W8C2_TRYCI|nr:unnamed protein product [Trypanosoma congolense IL3000]
MGSNMRIWESLRSDARQADNLIERKISALEVMARSVDVEGGSGHLFERDSHNTCDTNRYSGALSCSSTNAPDTTAVAVAPEVRVRNTRERFEHSRAELEMALQRFETLLGTMEEAASTLPPESAALTHTERFRQLAAEKRRSLTRIIADFRRRCERIELLPNINRELDLHREDIGTQLLLQEQESLRHTQRTLNNIIDRGEQAHHQLRGQRDVFSTISGRLQEISTRVPFVKNVLSKIDSKRRREAVILGSVIGVCFILVVLFI